ncbi:MAG: KH domain-containing protein [Anaerolineaceae bacterium]|nr:KH domain-containing protein [Anaerolineaceae bacterium]
MKGETVKELIEYIARSLVDNPDQVQVAQLRGGAGKVRLELNVAREDMGRVIGKSGRVANAMRVLLRVSAAREGKQVSLDVIEPR